MAFGNVRVAGHHLAGHSAAATNLADSSSKSDKKLAVAWKAWRAKRQRLLRRSRSQRLSLTTHMQYNTSITKDVKDRFGAAVRGQRPISRKSLWESFLWSCWHPFNTRERL